MPSPCRRSVLTLVALLGTSLAAGVLTLGPASATSTSSPCATVTLKATPRTNTAMVDERIKATVTNCSSTSETVVGVEHISGPTKAEGSGALFHKFTVKVAPGHTVKDVTSFPYSCCGSYVVTLKARVGSIVVGRATSSFTFA
jgi:hypothetical protein